MSTNPQMDPGPRSSSCTAHLPMGRSWNGVVKRLQAEGIQGDGPRQPAARHLPRLRLHQQLAQADFGPGLPSATPTAAR